MLSCAMIWRWARGSHWGISSVPLHPEWQQESSQAGQLGQMLWVKTEVGQVTFYAQGMQPALTLSS